MGKTRARKALPAFLIACALAIAPATAWADEITELAANTTTATVARATHAFTKQTTPIKVATSKGKVVSNGSYYIASANDTRHQIGSTKGNVLRKSATTAKSQQWKLQFDYDRQAYFIVNAATGKSLTAKAKPGDKTNVSEGKLNKNNKSQQWKVTSTATGFSITPASNKNVQLAIAPSGNVVVAKPAANYVSKFWIFGTSGTSLVKNGSYTLKNANGRLLTVPGRSTKANKRLSAANVANNLGQVFDFAHVSKGYFKISNVNSGLALTASKTKVVQRKFKSKDNTQLWKPVLLATGQVKLLNKQTGKALDLTAKNKAALAPTNARSATQSWTISPSASGLSAVAKKALYKANTRASKTKYCLVADLTAHELFVFQKVNPKTKKGPYVLKDSWRVASGANKCTGTHDGKVGYHKYNDNRYNCFYWTSIGRGSYMHSVLYASRTHPTRITDGRLGKYISHGCIRMTIDHAKWVYKNCHRGTAVSRYY